MSDKTELTEQDLNLIAQIDARLKHYNLIAPIEQVEEVKKFDYCKNYYKCPAQCEACKLTEKQKTPLLPDFSKYLSQQEQPIVKEEVKERYKPKPMEIYWSIDDTFNAYKTVGSQADRVNAGNCFPTEEAAKLVADKIKALLQTL